jgi:hypothetical protein
MISDARATPAAESATTIAAMTTAAFIVLNLPLES